MGCNIQAFSVFGEVFSEMTYRVPQMERKAKGVFANDQHQHIHGTIRSGFGQYFLEIDSDSAAYLKTLHQEIIQIDNLGHYLKLESQCQSEIMFQYLANREMVLTKQQWGSALMLYPMTVDLDLRECYGKPEVMHRVRAEYSVFRQLCSEYLEKVEQQNKIQDRKKVEDAEIKKAEDVLRPSLWKRICGDVQSSKN